MTKMKKIPNFKNEEEEANFWDTHDTTEYFDIKMLFKPNFSKSKVFYQDNNFQSNRIITWFSQNDCKQKGCSIPIINENLLGRKSKRGIF